MYCEGFCIFNLSLNSLSVPWRKSTQDSSKSSLTDGQKYPQDTVDLVNAQSGRGHFAVSHFAFQLFSQGFFHKASGG